MVVEVAGLPRELREQPVCSGDARMPSAARHHPKLEGPLHEDFGKARMSQLIVKLREGRPGSQQRPVDSSEPTGKEPAVEKLLGDAEPSSSRPTGRRE